MQNVVSFGIRERVYRLGIANIPAETIIDAFTRAELAGSVWSGFGFGAWGIEPTTFVEVATENGAKVREVAESLMREHGESAVYVTINGAAPMLWWNDGKTTTCGLETVENVLGR